MAPVSTWRTSILAGGFEIMTRMACSADRCARVRAQNLLVCAVIAACGYACNEDASPATEEPEVQRAEAPAMISPSACVAASAGGGWVNQAIPQQRGRFHVELEATATTASINAVIGLSAADATGSTQLAAIVRFNAAGRIEARDGASYRADTTLPYQAGVSYHIRFDVDLRGHTYSAWLRNDFGYTAIGRDYAFVTEQASVTSLANVASEVDAATGSFTICGVLAVADATTADGCVIAAAGDGFASIPLPDATVLDTLTFIATPSVASIDAVIGLSAGAVTSFPQLAATVRFQPTNAIDVYDSTGYRADASRPYRAGSAYHFRLTADLTTGSYSVLQGTFFDTREIARQYAFRSTQSAVPRLDHLSLIVDGGEGRITVCAPFATPSVGVAYSREGRYSVVPLAGDSAVISDGTSTRVLDPAGHVTAAIALGGELASDGEHIVIARASGTTLTADQYDNLAPRWHTTQDVLDGSQIRAMAVDPSGATRIGLVGLPSHVMVVGYGPDGSVAQTLSAAGDAVAFDGTDVLIAWNDTSTSMLRVSRLTSSGQTLWTRGFAGSAQVTAITIAPSHAVVLGGQLFTPMDFGGGVLPTRTSENGPTNGFVVELSQAGDHVFSRRTEFTEVGGIAANGTRIVVSNTERTQFRYARFLAFDPSGTPVATTFDHGLGENGVGDRLWIDASGRVWWSLDTIWPLFPRWPYLVALTP
jgi:hypothetical protein